MNEKKSCIASSQELWKNYEKGRFEVTIEYQFTLLSNIKLSKLEKLIDCK